MSIQTQPDATADVFLMGTAGKADDPNRSQWREPFKETAIRLGYTAYDPVVLNYDDAAAEREATALQSSKVLIMVINNSTDGFASAAETGWTVANALMNGQRVGFVIELPVTVDMENPVYRARALALKHAKRFAKSHPDLVFVARNNEELLAWMVNCLTISEQVR